LTAFACASAFASALLFAAWLHACRLEVRFIHYITPRVNLILTHSPALQKAALAQPDLLPVYGSSELAMPVPNRPMQFFHDYPTGFEVYPIGEAGTYPLIMLQKLAAAGPQLRGRRIAISLSSGWFRREEMPHDPFAGNFSPLDRCEFVFSSQLSFELKREVARRLGMVETTGSRPPVAAFALRQLADPSPLASLKYWAAWPLGRLQTSILRLQDHYEAWRFLADKKGHPERTQHHAQTLDWPKLIAAAGHEAGDQVGNEKDPAASTPEPELHDRMFIHRTAESHLWTDFTLLLRTLRELGAEPLILSTPCNGPAHHRQLISRSARQHYYERLLAVTREFGFPVRDFEEHDEDRHFILDEFDHLSPKGWMYYDEELDHFFHASNGAQTPAATPAGR
jgi:D-alanine transfer protein